MKSLRRLKELLQDARRGHYAVPAFDCVSDIYVWLIQAVAPCYNVPIALHLDHATDLDLIRRCIDNGFTSVMFDGSMLSYEENIGLTQRVVELARPHGVSVEAELGAHFVKTYYCEPGFEEVVAGCPVPIVIAGGKKLPELEALTMAYNAIDQGAAGVDMGRNIFLADDPPAMLQAVRAVVHEGEKPDKAYNLYQTLKK